jgi:hypothetical protein
MHQLSIHTWNSGVCTCSRTCKDWGLILSIAKKENKITNTKEELKKMQWGISAS